jgi:uroporphyrinogen decarboxylase
MRQAGRYLPEYRQTRKEAGGFLKMVYNPEIASEITLQPIRRFKMDGAILFSDILIVPNALGQSLEFIEGKGPQLGPIKKSKLYWDSESFDDVAGNIYKTVSTVKHKLEQEKHLNTTLIGFAGSPWTVLTYMIEKGPSKNFDIIKRRVKEKDEQLFLLLDLVVEATIHYLKGQIKAGAECVKLFDSWSGVLKGEDFDNWVINPTRKIVEAINLEYPEIPIIGFPRGAGENYEKYLRETKITALALDQFVSFEKAKNLQKMCPIQGNLDPELLLEGPEKALGQAEKTLKELSKGPYIFNLGHGVNKETNPETVQKLVSFIRENGS